MCTDYHVNGRWTSVLWRQRMNFSFLFFSFPQHQRKTNHLNIAYANVAVHNQLNSMNVIFIILISLLFCSMGVSTKHSTPISQSLRIEWNWIVVVVAIVVVQKWIKLSIFISISRRSIICVSTKDETKRKREPRKNVWHWCYWNCTRNEIEAWKTNPILRVTCAPKWSKHFFLSPHPENITLSELSHGMAVAETMDFPDLHFSNGLVFFSLSISSS